MLRVLRDRRAGRIVVEDPSHRTVHERIRALGLELFGAPVDAEGMTLADVTADAAVVTPAHQFPTGSVLSGRRRRALLGWARERGALILEDDYDSEFRYDREPVRALQGLAPDQVIHLGTVSKTLAPALRLGWLVVPHGMVDDVVRAKRLVDDFSPTLGQLTLARFLHSGDYDRHVRRARGVYRERRDRLLAALREHLPQVEVEGVAAGLHVLVWLPPGLSDTAIAADAGRRGLAIVPLSAFRVTAASAGGLVLGYGSLHESAIIPAIRSLAEVIPSR